MNFDTFFLGAPRWVLPAAAIAAVLLLAVLWNYLRGGWSGWRALAATLKIVAIATLVVTLVEPRGRAERPIPRENLLPIVVDTSRSMTLRNSQNSQSFADRVHQAFEGGSGWGPSSRPTEQLEQIFDVRRYAFDARLRGSHDFASLTFDGEASNLRTALETLGDRFKGRPVAGLLLASDGNWTDAAAADWSQLGFPVYPVRDTAAERLRDLRIADVSVSQTDFETAPVTIDVSLEKVDLPDEPISVRLLAEDGTLVEEKSFADEATESEAGPAGLPLRFRFRPETAGVSFYRVECFLERERKRFEAGESRVESTLENNRRWVAVHRRRGPYSVLYVGGRPNWEFKFLRRAIDADAEVRLLGLLRIARKQPKFSFRDASLGSTNPLFAGLGGDEEEAAEQLDEPVLLRLGVTDAQELVEGFPSDPDALFPFSAIILDDVEADFFTQDQLLLLRRFVSNRGGALLMLGGQEALERGGYADSPLGELAPVYLSRGTRSAAEFDGPSGPYRVELTREGLLQPFLRLRSTEAAEAARLSLLPPLSVLNSAEQVKPGAMVLAVARDSVGAPQPAFVSQPFGNGKTAALLLGDLWRWSLRAPVREPEDREDASQAPDDDPAQTWRQMVRWLVNDVPSRVEARIEPATPPGTIRVAVEVRDPSFTPLDGATVSLRIETPDQPKLEVTAVPSPEEAGVYTAAIWPRTAGGYRVTATATAADGSEIGTAETDWAHDAAGDEFERLGANLDLLEEIARESGGRVVPLEELDEFASSLDGERVPVKETWAFPLWHRPWVMTLAILCLCGEWGIRRWKGMP
ncbi:hypothetical protein [Candidatus Laterigemmans baculatus]|uniref:hypothetical protein n=1 Tax=Candidatus Laterigemmans baculatus TaxID=2770505 RepID=UPI001F2E8194|nr:hypothetical protein [Candidatus Laterigemmans baculatus]